MTRRDRADLRLGYILAHRDAGRSCDRIAKRLGISKQAVQQIIKRAEKAKRGRA